MALPKPDYYTEKEGGTWKAWPKKVKFCDVAMLAKLSRVVTVESGTMVEINGLYVASLLFGDKNKLQKSIRWDAVNGFDDWSGLLPEVRKVDASNR